MAAELTPPSTFEGLARAKAELLDRDVDLDVLTATLNIVRISNMLINDLESRVHRPSGWTWAGFRVMFAAWVTERAEPRELARLAGVSRASVSGVLNTLERDGLIARERKSADRRVVTVHLTARGRRALLKAFRENHEIEKAWLGVLSRREIEDLTSLLHQLHSPFKAAAGTRRSNAVRTRTGSIRFRQK